MSNLYRRTTNWLLRLPFYQEALKEKSIEAFKFAYKDILDTMVDDTEERADALSQEKLRNLLTVIDDRYIVSVDTRSKTLLIGGEPAEDIRIANLKAEAVFFLQSDLWKLLYETPKKLAQDAMFVSGEDLAAMTKGRSVLYTLATQKKILDTIQGLSTGTP